MGWAEAAGATAFVRDSAAESGVLAPHVAHLWIGAKAPRDPEGLDALLDDAADTDLLIVRFASQHTWIVPRLLRRPGVVVPAGNIAYWRHAADAAAGGDTVLEIVTETSADEFRDAVRETFAGYVNHYASNPWLRPVGADVAYADWAVRSIRDPGCSTSVTRCPDGHIAAVSVVAHTTDGTDEILLAGVRPSARGGGAYARYLQAVVAASKRSSSRGVVISTQDHNVRVQRLWGRGGFEPCLGLSIVHLVGPRHARI